LDRIGAAWVSRTAAHSDRAPTLRLSAMSARLRLSDDARARRICAKKSEPLSARRIGGMSRALPHTPIIPTVGPSSRLSRCQSMPLACTCQQQKSPSQRIVEPWIRSGQFRPASNCLQEHKLPH
jgi:hypothetical protein